MGTSESGHSKGCAGSCGSAWRYSWGHGAYHQLLNYGHLTSLLWALLLSSMVFSLTQGLHCHLNTDLGLLLIQLHIVKVFYVLKGHHGPNKCFTIPIQTFTYPATSVDIFSSACRYKCNYLKISFYLIIYLLFTYLSVYHNVRKDGTSAATWIHSSTHCLRHLRAWHDATLQWHAKKRGCCYHQRSVSILFLSCFGGHLESAIKVAFSYFRWWIDDINFFRSLPVQVYPFKTIKPWWWEKRMEGNMTLHSCLSHDVLQAAQVFPPKPILQNFESQNKSSLRSGSFIPCDT